MITKRKIKKISGKTLINSIDDKSIDVVNNVASIAKNSEDYIFEASVLLHNLKNTSY